MTKTVLAVSALLLVAGGPAWTQTAKTETPEAKAAMERAQRLAANPMKIILQAGKIRRKGEGEPASEPPADATNLRRTAARTGDAPVPAATQSAPAAAPEPPPRAAPVVPAVPAPELQAKLLPVDSLPAVAAAAAVPALEAASAVVDTPPVIAKPSTSLAAPLPELAWRPTLVSMVEPDIPVRLLSETGRVGEVMADLSLRADGSVGDVSFASPLPRSWRGYITAALQQWRFEPLPGAQVHRVQLVFSEK